MHMANSVFIVRPDSIYDDIPSEQYQFPKQYLERVKQSVGDWIIYLEPRKVTDTRGYFALAKVQDIIPDRRADGMFLAVILPGSMMEFGAHVPFRVDNDVVERGVLNSAGKISGRAQSAVRPLSSPDFERICALGLDTSALPRVDAHEQPGFAEGESAYDFGSLAERAMTFSSRKVRDANFRNAVISAYDRRCAISGLKLINGLGRAEVEAAHIKSVEANGPDIVQNGCPVWHGALDVRSWSHLAERQSRNSNLPAGQ